MWKFVFNKLRSKVNASCECGGEREVAVDVDFDLVVDDDDYFDVKF